jgi:hypothetical protein
LKREGCGIGPRRRFRIDVTVSVTLEMMSLVNIHLNKFGQNADLWTFCDHDKGIGGSWQAAIFLKIERINFILKTKT